MARFGQRRDSRLLFIALGIIALVAIFASFGTPKAGCAWSADDTSETDDDDDAGPLAAASPGEGEAREDRHAPTEAGSDTGEATSNGPAAPPSPGERAAGSPSLLAIEPETFCTTAGAVAASTGRLLRVETAGMRGVIAADKSRVGELAFTFRGQSETMVPLANGEMRQQIGLKLRAQDSCNVVYVMWRVAPKPSIGVSVKSNPGQQTHAQCADRGYINPKPATSAPPPAIEANVPHVLRAELVAAELTVHADGVEVWKGPLPEELFAFDGAVGVRSDNGTFDFELRVPGGGSASARCTNAGTELAH